jgi:hypothetical protein
MTKRRQKPKKALKNLLAVERQRKASPRRELLRAESNQVDFQDER